MKNGRPSIWITGASQGLGRALAVHYANQGYHVYASARNTEALEELRDENLAQGHIIPMPVDITEPEAVSSALSAILDQDSLDAVILNAGTFIHQPVERFNLKEIQQMVDLNLIATARCIEALLPHMLARESGQIAIVSSLAGYRGLPNSSGYGATKAALINMAESLKLDLEPKGVDIRLINPGFIETPLTAKNRFPMPDIISADTAAKIIYEGLQSKRFEIRFPTRFAWTLNLLSMLPYTLYLPLVRRFTRQSHHD